MTGPFEGTLFSVLVFPHEWPPKEPCILLKHVHESGTVIVTAGSRGEIGVSSAHLDGATMAGQFQRASIRSRARVIVGVVWGPAGVELELNGVSLQKDPHGILAPIGVLTEAQSSRPTPTLIYPKLE